MRFEKVHFANFHVDPEEHLRDLPQYKTRFWPIGWSIILVKRRPDFDLFSGSVVSRLTDWAKEQAQAGWDWCSTSDGDYLVAFEDDTDAILFKVSFDGAV